MLSFHSRIKKKDIKSSSYIKKILQVWNFKLNKKKFMLCANKNTISTHGTKNLQLRFCTEVYQPTCISARGHL